ncbi:MAG TPA: DUF3016 domain-containing protein [Opitutus sp.]|nr:DUF3016 domain-containing protein [Opitutus sp.]
MKTIRYTLIALLGAATMGGLRAADAPNAASPRVDVVFSHPEKFTDAARDQRGSDFGLDQNLDDLKQFIVSRAEPMIPQGDKLTITFTDIDLAGEYEPWRTPGRGGEARIVKDIYIPRMDLSFKLTDQTGAVIKEGTRHLTNMTFMMDILPATLRSEPLAYDKELVLNWLRDDFSKLRK